MRKIVPEKHAKQRLVLIHAARLCFSKYGFAATTTAMVQIEARSSTGKLFHYFPNKQALILAVIEDENKQIATWSDDLIAHPKPLLALNSVIDVIWQTASNSQENRLVLEIAAEASRNPEAMKLTSEGDRLLLSTINILINKAIEHGLINPSLKPDQITQLIMTWADGIFSRAGSDPEFLNNASLAIFKTGLCKILG